MKKTDSASFYVKCSLIVFIISLVIFGILGVLIIKSKNELVKQDEQWYKSYVIADELRQSSDDLTNFIRMYAATENSYYKEVYFEVLNIRNGTQVRPIGYEMIFWDLRLPNEENAEDVAGERQSINQRLKALGFTSQELALLEKAEEESNSLVNIELMAMRALEGDMSEEDLALMKDNESPKEFAIRILNDQAYLNAKYRIMSPIQDFYTMFQARTNRQIEESRRYASKVTNILFSFVLFDGFIFFILFSRIFRLFKDNEKRLEETIEERTFELKRKNAYLIETRDKLVEVEKMASLGNLVAGVAHEINTPIGIGVTVASHVEEETDQVYRKLSAGNLSKTALKEYLDLMEEESRILLTNMKRAGNLIRSFKQVAVDQSDDILRPIQVKEYIDEILLSLHSKFKRTKYNISVDSKGDMSMETYPGAIYQVITNLIMNSLVHGFEGREYGNIYIHIIGTEDGIRIIYEDDGNGISEDHQKKIYDPFFTTKRGSGGSGLGMNIVYNVIAQKLKGSINLESKLGQGVKFEIVLPRTLVHKD